MKTKQKKLRFSKGQISSRLLERQDLDVLDSSASEITNFISTPYGGLKSRQGTDQIDKSAQITISSVSSDYGDASGLASGGSFETTELGSEADDSVLCTIDLGSSQTVKLIKLKCFFDRYLVSASAPFPYNTTDNGWFTIALSSGSIASVKTVKTAYKNVTSTSYAIEQYGYTGSGAILTPVINDSGTVTGFTVVAGGSGYVTSSPGGGIRVAPYVYPTNPVLTSSLITIQTSTDGVTYTELATFTATNSSLAGDETKNITVNGTFRYIQLKSNACKGKLTIGTLSFSSSQLGSKLKPFSFNESNKYLVTLSDEKITIYEDEVAVTVIATGLLASLIPTISVSQQEDVMVFTCPDLQTKQLVRDSAYSKAFTGATSDVITSTGTVFYDGLKMRFTTTTTLPAGLSLDTDYYAMNSSGDTCKVSLTLGGTAVNITDAGTGTHTLTVQGVYWTFGDFPLTNIPKFAFSGEITTAKTTTLDPDVTEGLVTITESGAGSGTTFTTASVGQIIDGGGGRVLITDYISATKIRGITIIPFYTADAFTNFNYITGYEDVWSSTRGWPNSCLFYQQRLWFGGSKQRPNTIWGSRVDDYANFKNVGNFDNDSIEATIASNQVNEIINIFPNRGLQVFTAGGEWVVPENSLTPDSFTIINNTANGAKKGITPVNISGTTLFIEKNGKSLLSFTYNDGQGTYVTSQMSLLTDLIQNPIDMDLAMNSSQNEANYLYIVNEDGTMVVSCIMMDHKINSYVKFETDGKFKDVCVLGDDVYVLTERDSGLYLEKFVEGLKTDNTKEYTITDGVVTIDSGYEGKTVHAYDDTNDYGTHVVTSGEIEIDKSSGTVYVGLDFEYTLLSNKISINTQTDNIEKRIAKATIVTKDTETLTFCNQTITQEDDVFEYYGVTSPNRDTRFTITGEFVPVEILSILLNINYGDK